MKRGYTLIETIVVMTGGSALMGIAVVLLCVLFRADGSWRDHVQRSVTVDRLSERFRRDVRAAAGPLDLDEENALACSLPLSADGDSCFVLYQIVADELVERWEKNVGQPDRSEWYDLPEGCTVRFETEPLGGATLARLVIEPEDRAAGGQVFRVEAVVGRDRRFALPVRQEEKEHE